MRNTRVDKEDIYEAARSAHGLRDASQIDYAILEKTGGISIIPKEQPAT